MSVRRLSGSFCSIKVRALYPLEIRRVFLLYINDLFLWPSVYNFIGLCALI